MSKGGGVSIYISYLFHLEIIKNYSKSIDSICEILNIKISNRSLNNKEFIISALIINSLLLPLYLYITNV